MAEKKPIKLADTMAGRIEQLADERHAVELGGGEDRLQKQRDRGKQTARERIDNLVDAYSFDEVGAFRKHRTTLFGMDKAEVPADGVVTGRATHHGRPGLHRHGWVGWRDPVDEGRRDDGTVPADRHSVSVLL